MDVFPRVVLLKFQIQKTKNEDVHFFYSHHQKLHKNICVYQKKVVTLQRILV